MVQTWSCTWLWTLVWMQTLQNYLILVTSHFFQRTGLVNVTKKHLQLFYGRKIRQAKLKGDEQRLRASVANWPNFRLQTSKGAGKKFVRPNKLAAEFLSNIRQKGPKKGQKLFLSSFL
jgi:hypothetical protein